MKSTYLYVALGITNPNLETFTLQQDAFEIHIKENKNIVSKEFVAEISRYFVLKKSR